MRKLKSFFTDNKAVAFLEFAIALPFLLLLICGAIELSRYAQFKQKVDNAVANITNLINQTDKDSLDVNTLNYISAVFPESLKPYTSSDWEVIITAVYSKAGVDCDVYSLWQVERGFVNYTPERKSEVADGEEQIAVIKNYNNPITDNDQLITVELFLNYEPLISNKITESIGLGKKPMYSMFVSRPRYGAFMKHPETGDPLNTKCKLDE